MKAPSPNPADREPESHAQLLRDLAELRDAYARVAPPFVFQPTDAAEGRPARVLRLRVAGAGFGLLATAAGLLLAMALWQVEPPVSEVGQPIAQRPADAPPEPTEWRPVVAQLTVGAAGPKLVPVSSKSAATGLTLDSTVQCSLSWKRSASGPRSTGGRLPGLVPSSTSTARSITTFSIRTPSLKLCPSEPRRKSDATDQPRALDMSDDGRLGRPAGRAA